MAKNAIPQYSQTRTSNSDIGGIGLTDNDSAGNLRDGLQELMKQLKDTDVGDSPLDDSFRIMNATDNTKSFGHSAANIPSSTERVLDIEHQYRYGAARWTVYSTAGSFTHTFDLATTYFQIEAVGGGGGGGGVDGQGASTFGVSAGGASGFFGATGILAKGAILTGSVVIGAAGAGGLGLGGLPGDAGGDTTWTDSTNNFTWGGGGGGNGFTAVGASSLYAVSSPTKATSSGSSTIYGSADFNSVIPYLFATAGNWVVAGGNGCSSRFGAGGAAGRIFGGSTANVGDAGTGFGSGGGGAACANTTANAVGGDGRRGLMIVREW